MYKDKIRKTNELILTSGESVRMRYISSPIWEEGEPENLERTYTQEIQPEDIIVGYEPFSIAIEKLSKQVIEDREFSPRIHERRYIHTSLPISILHRCPSKMVPPNLILESLEFRSVDDKTITALTDNLNLPSR